jgi:beta-galactosidase
MIDDEGWIYVNGKLAGESHDWQAAPAFDVKALLHPGENALAVAVVNHAASGGVNKGVSLRLEGRPELPVWKRGAFNGLAQVIVQSTGQPGQISLAAGSPGLTPATVKIEAQPAPIRPAVPAE